MRALFLFLFGCIVGAAGFHLYYLGLDNPGRCQWDKRLGHPEHSACGLIEGRAVGQGYGDKARRDLDRLVKDISR